MVMLSVARAAVLTMLALMEETLAIRVTVMLMAAAAAAVLAEPV